MHISQFEICNTDKLEQLNGSIIIININDRVGYAVITVKEKSDFEHSSLEKIKSEDGGKTWVLTNPPHRRQNGDCQDWKFEFLGARKGQTQTRTNSKYDTNMYKTYLYYHLTPIPKQKQGNGTGTAGNTGGN